MSIAFYIHILYNKPELLIEYSFMYIAISIDLASEDSKDKFLKIMNEYGIKKSQINLYESFDFLSNRLGNLKKEIAACIDMDDKLKIYQYPVDNILKISYVENGKWKKLSIS